MAKSVLEQRLAALQDKIDKSKPVHGFQDLPAGTYPARITAAVLGMSKGNEERGTQPAPQVTFEYTITGDKCAGRKVRRFIGLEWESKDAQTTGMDLLQGEMECLGLDRIESSVDVAKRLPKCVGKEVLLKARAVDERTYYDVVELLDGGNNETKSEEEAEPDATAEGESESEEPSAGPTRAQVKTMTARKLRELAELIDITGAAKMDEKKLRTKVLEELGL